MVWGNGLQKNRIGTELPTGTEKLTFSVGTLVDAAIWVFEHAEAFHLLLDPLASHAGALSGEKRRGRLRMGSLRR